MLRHSGPALSLVLFALVALSSIDVAVASPSRVAKQRGTFELLTYNVAGLPEGISRSRPAVNLPVIGKLLNKYDIALVQEDFAYPLELRRAIRHGHASPPFIRGERFDFGDGLSQFARLPFTEFRRVPWSSCHGVFDSFFDCLTPKGFTWARQSLGGDISVHVYNLHMDAGWSGGDRLAREGQIAQLVATIRGESADAAVIVGGDTNILWRERALLERLLGEAKLKDACSEARCSEPWRIDRVLYRSSSTLSLEARKWRIAPEFIDAQGRPLSDHLAVAVGFEWQHTPTVVSSALHIEPAAPAHAPEPRTLPGILRTGARASRPATGQPHASAARQHTGIYARCTRWGQCGF